jgi:hypothetical protein
MYGTVNAKAVDPATTFGPEQAVSPKQLSSGEKQARWKGLWFPAAMIVNAQR